MSCQISRAKHYIHRHKVSNTFEKLNKLIIKLIFCFPLNHIHEVEKILYKWPHYSSTFNFCRHLEVTSVYIKISNNWYAHCKPYVHIGLPDKGCSIVERKQSINILGISIFWVSVPGDVEWYSAACNTHHLSIVTGQRRHVVRFQYDRRWIYK